MLDWDYKVGDQVLLRKDGILRKSESWYECDPWTITQFIQMGQSGFNVAKSEGLNIRRVTTFLTIRLNIGGALTNGSKIFFFRNVLKLTNLVVIGIIRIHTKFEDKNMTRSHVLAVFCVRFAKITSD